jgi:VWFA-related protein
MADGAFYAKGMDRRRFVLAASSLAWGLRGQSAPEAEEPTFKTEVKVVNVLATVRNKSGALISDLTKDDFTITEDARPQTIRYFSRQTDLPLTIGLLVDTSMSQVKVLDYERGASFRFIDQILRETKDKVFVMQFDVSVQVRQGLTANRKELDDALTYVDAPTRNELRTMTGGGGTLLYDSIVRASEDIMSKQQGRKAVFVMTDGVDFGSENTVTSAIEAAQKADTLIYSILFADSGYGDGDGRPVLMRMSSATGGGFYIVSKKLTIDQIFEKIEAELRGQYSLGYVSDKRVGISEWRKIKLTTNQPGLVVQARERYWAQR